MYNTSTSKQNTNLEAFKKQLHGILSKIDELKDDDKNEALRYVQQFIEGKANSDLSPTSQKTVDGTSYPKKIKRVVEDKPMCKANPPIRFKCIACDETRKTKRCMLNHIEECHIGTPISCLNCKRVFTSRAAFDWHKIHLCKQEGHSTNNPIRGMECPKMLQNHDRYKCLSCNKKLSTKKQVYLHKKQGHKVQGLEPKFHCPFCTESFHRTLLLHKHLQKHKDKKTLECKMCDMVFSNEQVYFKHCMTVYHIKEDPEIRDYICEYCGKIFTQLKKLNIHLWRYHKVSSRCFSCLYCKYQTHLKANFERHINLHLTESDTYICDYCGKSFSDLAVLNDHINYNHIEEKKLKCDQCSYSCKRRQELIRHKGTHSDVRPYMCIICDRAFKRLTHLRRHETSLHSKTHKSNKVQRLKTNSVGEHVPVFF